MGNDVGTSKGNDRGKPDGGPVSGVADEEKNGRPEHIDGQGEFQLATEITVAYPIEEIDPPSWPIQLAKTEDPDSDDKDPKCPKCNGRLSESYHPSGLVVVGSACYDLYTRPDLSAIQSSVSFPEHMDVQCSRCGHSWVQAPLDSASQE